MARYPFLVECCWEVVKSFAGDLAREGLRLCWTERDVQTELARRLREMTRLVGKPTISVGEERKQGRPRVSCDAKVNYLWQGQWGWLYPDIVLWGDERVQARGAAASSEHADRLGEQHVALWACEIKFYRRDPDGVDLEKLRLLLDQGIAQYGCWIDVREDTAGARWTQHGDATLWSFEVGLRREPEEDASA